MGNFQLGFPYLHFAMRDNNGYPMGALANPNSPTNGVVYTGIILQIATELAEPQATFEEATQYGGGKIHTKKIIGVSDYGTGSLTLSSDDTVLRNLTNLGTDDTSTMSGWTQRPGNVNAITPPGIVIAQMPIEKLDGTRKWLSKIYPNAQIKRQGNGATQSGGVNPSPVTYQISPSPSARALTGRLFSAMAMNVINNTDTYYEIETDYPIYVSTYVDDGSTGTFTVPYKLASTDATGAARNAITDDGATLAVTSVNATSGLVTQDTQPAAASRVVFVGESASDVFTAVS